MIKQNKHHLSADILLLVCAVIISLSLGELLLALLGVEPSIKKLTVSAVSAEMKADSMEEMAEKGFVKGVPYGNLLQDLELGYTYYGGHHGFPDKKDFYDDWSGYTRVLVLGDSFARGNAAQPGKGFVDLLELHYKEQKVLFFNTGVGGYSQNNQLSVLRKYSDVIKPHIVILCFYSGNDFIENLSPVDRYTAFPDLWVANYEIIHTPDDLQIRRRDPDEIFMIFRQHLKANSSPEDLSFKTYLKYNVFYRSRIGSLLWVGLHKTKHAAKIGRKDNSVPDHTYRATRDLVGEMKGFLSNKGIPLYAFVIPDKRESKTELKRSRDYENAISLFEELSIPYLDPFDSFVLEDYLEIHWNDSGHFKAYERLRNYIDTEDLLHQNKD